MDKILEFIKEAKWFSISIGIFMVIWFGPNLLDRFEENKLEAERQARAVQREIVRQEQLKEEAIEKERREKREAIEKIEKEKRIAAEKIEKEKRIAAEMIRKEKEAEQREIEKRKLKELEVGLVCRASYIGNYVGSQRESKTLLIELILIRDLAGNVIDGLSIVENKFDGTEKTIKEFYSAKNNKSVNSYSKKLEYTEVNYSISVNAKVNASHPSFKDRWENDKNTIHIDRASLGFTFTDDDYLEAEGRCSLKNAQLIRQEVEAHNNKNKSGTKL